MQYTITAINGGEITVTYADGSYANVAIETNDSLATIDEKVGAFTNAYTIDDAPNPYISVGDVRQTIDPEVAEAARIAAAEANANTSVDDVYRFDWANTGSYATPATAYYLAHKLSAEGDQSFLDMINARLQTIQDDPEFSLDALKAAFNDSLQ
tara:strand:- start:2544 stop:3005 length:462 start_codon:yes stop_codon:yes gene_type:complete